MKAASLCQKVAYCLIQIKRKVLLIKIINNKKKHRSCKQKDGKFTGTWTKQKIIQEDSTETALYLNTAKGQKK
jgi:hypothetical protein